MLRKCGTTRVAADLWDRDYLDLAGPAYFQIGDQGWAEFAFGAADATAELGYGQRIVFLIQPNVSSIRWLAAQPA